MTNSITILVGKWWDDTKYELAPNMDVRIGKSALRGKFESWARKKNRNYPVVGEQMFTRALNQAVPGIRITRIGTGKARERQYLIPAQPQDDFEGMFADLLG